EGLNQFAVVDVSAVTPALLASYDVVLLAKTSLNAAQVSALTNWVNGGGNLIAMNPDPQLASLAGLTIAAGTLSEGYILPNSAHAIAGTIASSPLQFHGTASRYTPSGATSLATLYATAGQPTSYAAITLRQVAANGGEVATFAYD